MGTLKSTTRYYGGKGKFSVWNPAVSRDGDFSASGLTISLSDSAFIMAGWIVSNLRLFFLYNFALFLCTMLIWLATRLHPSIFLCCSYIFYSIINNKTLKNLENALNISTMIKRLEISDWTSYYTMLVGNWNFRLVS